MKKLLLLLFLLGSCTTTRMVEVPVESTKTEYIYNTLVDSVVVRDSIDRFIKGDSIYVYIGHTEHKLIYKTDTLIRVDTIPQIVEVQIDKEVNRLYWWQKTLMWLGAILSILGIVLVCRKWI